MKVLCIGDVVARPGRELLKEKLSAVKKELGVDLAIINGENSAGGSGIDKKCFRELQQAGADVITLGDHTWRRAEVRDLLGDEKHSCICPGNYPPASPARGWCIHEVNGTHVGVVNVLGRTFLNSALDCPFKYAEQLLKTKLRECSVCIVDFHGEATSEKWAFARHFDGRVSAIVGTHTHVATADEEVLPGGTAFITDMGMTGSHQGVIGMDSEVAIKRFLTGVPSTYKPAAGRPIMNGVLIEIDSSSGRARSIERVRVLGGKLS